MERRREDVVSAGVTIEKLLSHYFHWGIAAACFFMISVCLLLVLMLVPGTPLEVLYFVLLCGFLWIGSTSFSRHSLVLLKQHIGRKIGIVEFLSTQFVAILFPLSYRKVKDEVRVFRERQEREGLDKA